MFEQACAVIEIESVVSTTLHPPTQAFDFTEHFLCTVLDMPSPGCAQQYKNSMSNQCAATCDKLTLQEGKRRSPSPLQQVHLIHMGSGMRT